MVLPAWPQRKPHHDFAGVAEIEGSLRTDFGLQGAVLRRRLKPEVRNAVPFRGCEFRIGGSRPQEGRCSRWSRALTAGS